MALCVKTGLLLCTLVLMSFIEAGASYSWSSQARLFSDLDSAVATQVADTCLLSGALEVCQAARVVKGDYSDYFHVCPKDGDPCNPELCYYTSIRPCCPNSPMSQCNSTSKLLVHGQTFDVTFYDVQRPGFSNTVCFKAAPSLAACGCEPECVNTACTERTVDCDDDGNCVCQPNYQPPDCCNCTASNDTHIIYRDSNTEECTSLCRLNCRVRIPNGPCSVCSNGFALPDCCNCPPPLTEINGVCRCEGNADANGNCINGFAPPDCCNCPPGLTEVNGVCKCEGNFDANGDCINGFALPDCCNCPPGLTEVNGVCKCESNADELGNCLNGFALPDCCNCPPGLTEDNGVCKCEGNFAANGDCINGFALPDCCNCPPGLTEVNGVCKCEGNFDSNGDCINGFALPDCCNCPPDLTEVNGVCKCDGNFDSNGNCLNGFALPDCCDCPPGRTEDNGVCKCDGNFDSNGNCINGFSLPDCCNCPTGLTEDINGVCKCEGNFDANGDCNNGFALPDCCNCPPGLTEVNGVCKCDGKYDLNGNCLNGFALPDCCDCPPGLTEDNGLCKCEGNFDSNGDCINGFVSPDCCNCPTGLTEVAGVCRCEGNADANGNCQNGYVPPTCCDCPPDFTENNGVCEAPCSREQSIYFLIDATGSYELNNFCRTVTLIQLLVAAFNPSASGPTKTYGYLFPNGDDIWSSTDSCTSTVEGKLTSLMEERRDKCSTSTVFPDICGDSTLAVPGLDVIQNVASMTTTPEAVLMITDGNIQDPDTEVETVVTNLKNAGVSTIIAAGLGQVDQNNLERYVLPAGMSANAVVRSSIGDLGIAIVERLEASGILCPDHANSITTLLNDLTTSIDDLYCACIPNENCYGENLQYKYPQCGGPLQIGYTTLNGAKMNLEEEIIAAVEGVLEEFDG